MKIRIIGGPGSGKSYSARYLSKKIVVSHADMDDLFWDNSNGFIKRDGVERNLLLENTLKNNSWIIEGVYYDEWCNKTFEEADKIFVFINSRWLQYIRIIRRSIKRKFSNSARKESFMSVYNLLKWCKKYNTKSMKKIENKLSIHNEKVIYVKSLKEILKYIEK